MHPSFTMSLTPLSQKEHKSKKKKKKKPAITYNVKHNKRSIEAASEFVPEGMENLGPTLKKSKSTRQRKKRGAVSTISQMVRETGLDPKDVFTATPKVYRDPRPHYKQLRTVVALVDQHPQHSLELASQRLAWAHQTDHSHRAQDRTLPFELEAHTQLIQSTLQTIIGDMFVDIFDAESGRFRIDDTWNNLCLGLSETLPDGFYRTHLDQHLTEALPKSEADYILPCAPFVLHQASMKEIRNQVAAMYWRSSMLVLGKIPMLLEDFLALVGGLDKVQVAESKIVVVLKSYQGMTNRLGVDI